MKCLGHEAFSSLVDVAVQQPSLPVPHKDEKRSEILTPPTSSHHDIRYIDIDIDALIFINKQLFLLNLMILR